jgi:hypothetical protein
VFGGVDFEGGHSDGKDLAQQAVADADEQVDLADGVVDREDQRGGTPTSDAEVGDHPALGPEGQQAAALAQ